MSKALCLLLLIIVILCLMLFVVHFQVEDEDTVTGARVVDGEEDEDEQGMESNLGRSKLRAAAEGSLTLLNTWNIFLIRFAGGRCQVQGQKGKQEDLGPRS